MTTTEGGAPREFWYRYIDPWTVGAEPYLSRIPVERHTAKCVVLNEYGLLRFVRKDTRKRYAYPTEELALKSYIIRKKRQIQYAALAHDNAKANLEAAEAIARGEIAPRPSVFDVFDETC